MDQELLAGDCSGDVVVIILSTREINFMQLVRAVDGALISSYRGQAITIGSSESIKRRRQRDDRTKDGRSLGTNDRDEVDRRKI
jgi:hypothetical protein